MPEPKSTYPWAAARKLIVTTQCTQVTGWRVAVADCEPSAKATADQGRRLFACRSFRAGNLSDCKGLEPDHCPEYRAVLDDVERESVAAVIHADRPIASDDR